MEKNNVIIVGCQRSGTSALWRALIRHPVFLPCNISMNDMPKGCEKELWHVQEFMKGRDVFKDSKCHGCTMDNNYMDEYFQFINKFISKKYGGVSGQWLYSHPADGFYTGEILKHTNNVKILFMVRHPQEVVWSALHAPWEEKLNRNKFLVKAKQAARHWKKFAIVFDKEICGINKDRLMLVRNEELRKAPEEILNSIYNFVNIKPDHVVLDTLNQGVFNSSFLALNTAPSEIDSVKSVIGNDIEFCRVVREETQHYMKYFGYKCLSLHIEEQSKNTAYCKKDETDVSVVSRLQGKSRINENYWKENLDWYEKEVASRKENIHSYLHQEIYLSEYFRLNTEQAGDIIGNDNKVKILEFGFGFSRHLKYIVNHRNIDCYGCDISSQSLDIAHKYFTETWCDEHLKIIKAGEKLPYDDNEFDIVFTVSVLIHIHPDDLNFYISELIRICQGCILHIENPVVDATYMTSTMHQGCWAHALEIIYGEFNVGIEKLTEFSPRHGVYRIGIGEDRGLENVSDLIANNLYKLELSHNKAIERIDKQAEKLDEYEVQRNTRAHKIQRWLRTKPWIEKTVVSLFDGASKIYKTVNTKQSDDITIVNTNNIELIVNTTEPKIISICHPHWHGVCAAAEGQTDNVLYLKECNKHEVNKAVEILVGSAASHFIFNGFWAGYDQVICGLREASRDCKIFYVHHGSFYQMGEDRTVPDVLAKMLRLHEKGILDKIGFVKFEMADALNKLGIDARYVMNSVKIRTTPSISKWELPVKIGIPVQENLRKNVHTQIMAALLLEGVSEIHLWHKPNLSYLEIAGVDLDKLIIHSNCGRQETLELIADMTAVLYTTISECHPMILLESFSVGTPCFTSNTHGILSEMPDLMERLIVSEADNPMAIAKHIEKQISSYSELSEKVISAYKILDKKAEENLQEFINI